VLLVLGISTTHSKEYIEGRGESHAFVKFSFYNLECCSLKIHNTGLSIFQCFCMS